MDIRLRPISLSVFTTIFIAIFLILLFSLGRITYQEVAKLDSQFLAANTLRAEGEIRTALDNSLQTIEYKTQQLANWEETVQQKIIDSSLIILWSWLSMTKMDQYYQTPTPRCYQIRSISTIQRHISSLMNMNLW
ncbi:MAG: hypothetical protein P8179_15255 [Candidatus Thiodiazotropha sp.]